jgi:hypothetical protein
MFTACEGQCSGNSDSVVNKTEKIFDLKELTDHKFAKYEYYSEIAA